MCNCCSPKQVQVWSLDSQSNKYMYLFIDVCICTHNWFPDVCITKKKIQLKSLFQKKQSTHLKMLWIRFLNQLHFVSANPQFQYRIYAKVLTVVEKWNLHNSIEHCSSHMVKIIYCNPQMVLACLNVETPTK